MNVWEIYSSLLSTLSNYTELIKNAISHLTIIIIVIWIYWHKTMAKYLPMFWRTHWLGRKLTRRYFTKCLKNTVTYKSDKRHNRITPILIWQLHSNIFTLNRHSHTKRMKFYAMFVSSFCWKIAPVLVQTFLLCVQFTNFLLPWN